MNEPKNFRAGDSASWSESLPDYPASAGWSLKYRLMWPSGSGVNLTANPVGDDYAITLASASTASWLAGSATLVSWVEKGSERVTLAQQAHVVPTSVLGSARWASARGVTPPCSRSTHALRSVACGSHRESSLVGGAADDDRTVGPRSIGPGNHAILRRHGPGVIRCGRASPRLSPLAAREVMTGRDPSASV